MSMRRLWSTGIAGFGLAASLLVTTACCEESETVLVVESPVYAEWTRTESTTLLSGGKFSLWSTHTNHTIYISRSPPIGASVDCSGPNPELVGDPIGDRLAYRCEAGEWQMLHLGVTGKAFPVEKPGLGSDKTPNWAAGESFEQSAREFIEIRNDCEEWLDEAKARDLMLFARLLVAWAESTSTQFEESWDKRFDGLPGLVQQEVRSMFRARILQPNASPMLVYFAAKRLPVDDTEIFSALLDRANEMVAKKQENSEAAVSVAMLSLATKRPEDVSELACRALEAWPAVWRAPLLVIGGTKTQCAAVTALAKDDELVCKAMSSCASDGAFRLCSAEEASTEVRAALANSTAKDARPGLPQLAAWYAQGPLPERLTHAASRASYRIIEPNSPSCGDQDASLDQPCKCSEQASFQSRLPEALCYLGPGPSKKELAIGPCVVRVDDGTKRLIVVRRTEP